MLGTDNRKTASMWGRQHISKAQHFGSISYNKIGKETYFLHLFLKKNSLITRFRGVHCLATYTWKLQIP